MASQLQKPFLAARRPRALNQEEIKGNLYYSSYYIAPAHRSAAPVLAKRPPMPTNKSAAADLCYAALRY